MKITVTYKDGESDVFVGIATTIFRKKQQLTLFRRKDGSGAEGEAEIHIPVENLR